MRAAVLIEQKQPLIIEDVDIEEPKEGEVQVRITATGLCHSDLHNIKGDWQNNVPAILGHEGAGIVEAIGENVDHVKIGDSVIFSFRANCGHCANCTRGIPVLCNGHKAPRQLMNDGTARVSLRAQPLFVSCRLGTFAEKVVCAAEQAIPVTDKIPGPEDVDGHGIWKRAAAHRYSPDGGSLHGWQVGPRPYGLPPLCTRRDQ